MKENDLSKPKRVEADVEAQQISLIDDYFKHQSPLAQLVEIKGAFLKMLNLIDDLNAHVIKLNRRTANTNSRLSTVETRLREIVQDLEYYDIQIERAKAE